MAAFTALAIAGLVSAGVNAYGQYKAGKAQKKAAVAAGEHAQEASESQAELSDWNASIADLQATDAIARGAEQESRFRQGVRVMVGAQRAGLAASNVDVGFGSAVDVQADASFLGELDALTIRTNAAREAWGYKVQGEDLRKRAAIQRKEGGFQAEAGRAFTSGSGYAIAGTIAGATVSLLQARYGMKG